MSEEIGEDGGEKMLPGVLLHVIEAPVPVEASGHPIRVERSSENVGHAVALVDHVRHPHVVQGPQVERLAAGGRIERGAVEVDTRSLGAHGRSPPRRTRGDRRRRSTISRS